MHERGRKRGEGDREEGAEEGHWKAKRDHRQTDDPQWLPARTWLDISNENGARRVLDANGKLSQTVLVLLPHQMVVPARGYNERKGLIGRRAMRAAARNRPGG